MRLIQIALLCCLALAAATKPTAAWWYMAEPAPPAAGGASVGQQPGDSAALQPPVASSGPIKAEARFDMDGVTGLFSFNQEAAGKPTQVSYDLSNLKGNNQLYHVHVGPLPQFDAAQKANSTLMNQICSSPSVGGHLNPTGVKYVAGVKPETFELGDLAGKFGPLVVKGEDHYAGNFVDNQLSLKGANGALGRSIVIHKNTGQRWVCANIVELAS